MILYIAFRVQSIMPLSVDAKCRNVKSESEQATVIKFKAWGGGKFPIPMTFGPSPHCPHRKLRGLFTVSDDTV
jgi:hypothetical protein